MSVDVTVERVIGAPVAEVAAFAGDPANAPRWYARISQAEWQGPAEVAVGGRIAFIARFLGRTLSYTYEITELVEGERMVMRTAEGPFPMTTEYTWAPSSEGAATRMTLRNHGLPTGFSVVMAPLMSMAMRRAMTKDLAALATHLEAS